MQLAFNIEVREEKEYLLSEEDSKKDLAIIYVQTGINLVKLYGPSVVLGTLSIASILASNNILQILFMLITAIFKFFGLGN